MRVLLEFEEYRYRIVKTLKRTAFEESVRLCDDLVHVLDEWPRADADEKSSSMREYAAAGMVIRATEPTRLSITFPDSTNSYPRARAVLLLECD